MVKRFPCKLIARLKKFTKSFKSHFGTSGSPSRLNLAAFPTIFEINETAFSPPNVFVLESNQEETFPFFAAEAEIT